MANKLQFCPCPRSLRRASSWPRVYAQRDGSPVVFELHRGPLAHKEAFTDSNGAFGRGWCVWIERLTARRWIEGAHPVRSPLSPAA